MNRTFFLKDQNSKHVYQGPQFLSYEIQMSWILQIRFIDFDFLCDALCWFELVQLVIWIWMRPFYRSRAWEVYKLLIQRKCTKISDEIFRYLLNNSIVLVSQVKLFYTKPRRRHLENFINQWRDKNSLSTQNALKTIFINVLYPSRIFIAWTCSGARS